MCNIFQLLTQYGSESGIFLFSLKYHENPSAPSFVNKVNERAVGNRLEQLHHYRPPETH